MSDNQTACAHCKVVLKHTDHPDGTRSDYWECADGCGQKFSPSPPMPAVTAPTGSRFLGSHYEGQVGIWKQDKTGDEFLVIAPDLGALKRVMVSFGETVNEARTKPGKLVVS